MRTQRIYSQRETKEIRYFPHASLIPTAFDLAIQHRVTFYDAIFLALTSEQGAVLFTAFISSGPYFCFGAAF